jgi:hypothetical protein
MGTTPSVINQARLAACGYPTIGTTGVPANVVLATYTGSLSITTPGTVIDGKAINGCLRIATTGVVIRNSKITCLAGGWFGGIYGDDAPATGTPLRIERVEITCVDGHRNGVWAHNFIATGLYIHDCENGFEVNSNSTIQDSYIAAREGDSSAHGDDIQSQGGSNVVIRHNTFGGLNPITSSIITNPTQNSHWLIENNFLSAGAFTLYCPEDPSQGDFVVRNNRFMPARPSGATQPYDQRLGAYGLTDACNDSRITWTGNFRDNNLSVVGSTA